MPDMTFKAWLGEIDRRLFGAIGYTHRHLRDRAWFDNYKDELTPADVVAEILAEGTDAL